MVGAAAEAAAGIEDVLALGLGQAVDRGGSKPGTSDANNLGKRIADLGKNTETIAKARIDIEAMRMMVLKAAKAMDVLGNAEARV